MFSHSGSDLMGSSECCNSDIVGLVKQILVVDEPLQAGHSLIVLLLLLTLHTHLILKIFQARVQLCCLARWEDL